MNWKFLVVIGLMMVSIFFIYSCKLNSEKPTAPFNVNLNIEGKPNINGVVKLEFIVEPLHNLSNVSITIILPKGIEVVSGELSRKTETIKNEEMKLTAFVKITEFGNFIIEGLAMWRPSDSYYAGMKDSISISVSEDASVVKKHYKEFKKIPVEGRLISKNITNVKKSNESHKNTPTFVEVTDII